MLSRKRLIDRALNNFPASTVKLSGQTYFYSDLSHFWPDENRLDLTAIKVPLPFTLCLNMKQVNVQCIYCT